MKKIFLILLVLLSNSLMAGTFLPKSFRADFEQVRKSIVSGKIKKSKGVLEYRYPGNLKLHVTAPDELLLISNKRKTWYYRPPFIKGEKGELTVKQTGKTELSHFFDILKSGLKTNRNYSVKQNSKRVLLTLSKSSAKALQVSKAQLTFNGKKLFKNLSKLEIIQVDGKKLEFVLNSIEENVSFAKSHFIFRQR